MSRLVSRILLSIFLFPLAVIFYGVVCAMLEQAMMSTPFRNRENTMFMVADLATWTFIAIYWCLLWRSGVQWTSFRVTGSILSAFGAAVVGAFAGVIVSSVLGHGDTSFGIFLGGVIAMLLWLFATVFLWRETAAERAEQVKASSKSAITCPTCGYNLTGLTESRCPECGAKFTLDELMAMQVTVEKDIE
jgi:DNA-directed RNA polymerase subunit RPC12/RpoP